MEMRGELPFGGLPARNCLSDETRPLPLGLGKSTSHVNEGVGLQLGMNRRCAFNSPSLEHRSIPLRRNQLLCSPSCANANLARELLGISRARNLSLVSDRCVDIRGF